MNVPLRPALAAGLVLASVSICGVASASETHGSAKAHGAAKAKGCKKQGKGYTVQGTFAGGELTRIAGGATARRTDDRYSGTIIVDVSSGNSRGRRDVGLRSYAVTGVRTAGITIDGELPAEGARVELTGKLKTACKAGAASRLAEDETEDEAADDDVTVEDASSDDDGSSSDDRAGDPSESDDDSPATDDAGNAIPDAVTDVTVRSVRFKTA